MTDRVKISVMGITHSQIQKGAYAVLLTEDGGPHRIPVVVGIAEAQSIVAWMERVNLPRPLTHDLFRSVTRAFGIRVKEVFVSKFEKGIFYSKSRLPTATAKWWSTRAHPTRSPSPCAPTPPSTPPAR